MTKLEELEKYLDIERMFNISNADLFIILDFFMNEEDGTLQEIYEELSQRG